MISIMTAAGTDHHSHRHVAIERTLCPQVFHDVGETILLAQLQ